MINFDIETKILHGAKLPFPCAEDSSIGEEFIKCFDANPDRIIQINHDQQVNYTCKEIKKLSIRVAMNLMKMNIKSCDDVVGIMCRNSSHILPVLYGSIISGAPFNPLHVSFEKQEVIETFSKTNPKIVFCDHDVYHVVEEALKEINSDAPIYTTIEKIPGVKYIGDLMEEIDGEENFVAPKFTKKISEKILGIMLSSGTTGPSKGVLVPHKFCLVQMREKGLPFPYKSFNFSPIYWGSGALNFISAPFHPNETVVSTLEAFSLELLVEIIEKYSVDLVLLAPSKNINLLLNSPLTTTRNLSSLKIIASTGSLINDYTREKFKKILPGVKLTILYGMTESLVASLPPGQPFDGLQVGRALPNNMIKIVDTNENALEVGKVGEIYVKTEAMFVGYYKNPEANKVAFTDDGFLRTGDIGYIDDQGFVYVTARDKQIFKYNGFNINPAEIEKVIEAIEGVELVCVVGIPDSYSNELATAVYAKRPGFDDLTPEKVVEIVSEKLPSRKHLHGGAYEVDALPMTMNGKIHLKNVAKIALGRKSSQKA